MPCGYGTGPWWAQDWRCCRGFRKLRFQRRSSMTEPITLTKEDQKKILEAALKDIETEKQEIEKKLKELNK